MDFTAIDFETANRRRNSACQLAAVRVRDGKIVNRAMWMVRPEPMYFHPMNIRVHGITAKRVAAEPDFGSLWNQIAEVIGEDCVVAHNASFDIGVLQACLEQYEIPVPEISYTCTRATSRKTWPGRRRYGLKPLSTWLGVEFKHHDALEDSVACAKLLLAAGIAKGATSLPDLESRLGLSRGKLDRFGFRGPVGTRTRRPSRPGPQSGEKPATAATNLRDSAPGVDVQRLCVRAEFIRPFSHYGIVFTGQLRSIRRNQAEEIARRGGGDLQTSVTQKTRILVVGDADSRTRHAGRSKSVKEEAAERINAESGCETVRILTESEFLDLV